MRDGAGEVCESVGGVWPPACRREGVDNADSCSCAPATLNARLDCDGLSCRVRKSAFDRGGCACGPLPSCESDAIEESGEVERSCEISKAV